ncbi:uroporphyrinogen-III synthase [Litchfieldia alkalitelluris]|uniref:uroporphyrinogen-III synthase n=1 Tax=Litchfieldia alkalitelluris TaxID=304268 RepID=UPI0009981453|nr:uroporphyrinogen-III synthase [Litchfieldia alkalitelluris]
MKKLEGKRVALVGPRKAEEISTIVKNLGGTPLVRPAQGTVFLDDSNVEESIKRLVSGEFHWIILTTGVGTERLYNTSVKLGLGEEFLSSLQKIKIAARGYKTVNMLKKLGVAPLVRDDDGSTAGLVRSLGSHSLEKQNVALQLHGDPAPLLIAWLEKEHATYEELLPYIHTPPEEESLELLVRELLNGDIDAVAFTSTPQVRFLMSYARDKGLEEEVRQVFEGQVIALAVGKVTAQALREVGIKRIVYPENERMGSMIVELSNYYQNVTK